MSDRSNRNARGVTASSSFQVTRSTPRPLRVVRDACHGVWDERTHAVRGLLKSKWKNDASYQELSVTTGYAKVLSRVVQRISRLRRFAVSVPLLDVGLPVVA